jgi:myo-inositol-1(or 4)-monophosphatase
MTVPQEVLDRLNLAKVLAFDAGKLLMKYHGNLASYDHKGKVDLVTEADRASEAFIFDQVQRRFPNDAFLGEETGERSGISGYRWLVDPLDGTTNFVHTHPIFSVSIGVHQDRQAVAGVIYMPATRELFYAGRGMGAFGSRGPIRVSRMAPLQEAMIATGIPYDRRRLLDTLMEDWRRVILAAQGFHRLGSAAADLAYVACGRYEGFWERGLNPWDTAAGALIVEEAGGRVTNFTGGPFDPHRPECVATNGLIHDELLRTLFEGR